MKDIKSEALLNMLEDLEEEKKKLDIFVKGFDTSFNSMVLAKYEDKKAVIQRVNSMFCTLYGYEKSEAPKSPLVTLVRISSRILSLVFPEAINTFQG